MTEWNVVVSVNERGFRRAFEVLGEFGRVWKTAFFNVLVLQATDVKNMLDTLRERRMRDPEYLSFLSRLIPLTETFSFRSPEEFEKKSAEIVLKWIPELKGKGFHVRMRRRGFKGRLSSLDEEHFLDAVLLDALEKAGSPGHITFEKPDAIIAVETIVHHAGLSLWTRADLELYPFIRLD